MSNSHDAKTQETELETFQKHVAERFNDFSSSQQGEELLSLTWVRNILDIFITTQEEFRVILSNNKSYLSRPPMDRLINEFYERSVKALDVCNAIRDGIEQVRQWEKLIEIIICALDDHVTLGEGQVRRAKKCIIELLIGTLDEKESNVALSHRNRSFGRNSSGSGSGSGKDQKGYGHFRSLSWSVSRSWSASRQLQAMACNMNAPKGNDVMASNGLVVAVYTMSNVLVLVMWVLVAAIPCQDRGLQVHLSVPRQYVWAPGVIGIHERVLEESKKKDKKSGCGLMKEIWKIEKWSRKMNELLDGLQFPLSDEKADEVRGRVEELKVVFKAFKDGLYPLEKLVREVFHGIVRSRTEGLDSMGRGSGSD